MDWKTIGKKLLFPPVWAMLLLTAASAAALVTVFLNGWEESIPAYIVYVISFYTLSVVSIFLSMVLPKRYRAIRQKIYDNPFGNRYMTDKAFRTKVSLYISLAVNLLYVALQGLQWHLFRSWWFVVLAAYYAILSVMRFLLLRYVRANEIGSSILSEWKRSRICASILMLVNLCLSGAVLMILLENRGYDYPGVLIYVMALYSFYSTINAVVQIIKYRKLGSPVMSTAKVIALSAALVSMLNLETAMFSQFGGDMSIESQHLMIILTGAGISVAVNAMSAVLIVKSTHAIKFWCTDIAQQENDASYPQCR